MAIYVRNKEGVMESYKIVGLKGENGQDGASGKDGATPNITIGNVTTLEPNQQATVTREGTNENPIFNFGIPRGQDGTGGNGVSIDDNTVSTDKTWSSAKIEDFVLTNDNTIWSDVSGENLKVEHTKEGYLREVEILGNTIQNQDNLSDIKHLGELYVDDEGKPKLDSQGRKQYKIEVKSVNSIEVFWDKDKIKNGYLLNFGGMDDAPFAGYFITDYLDVEENTKYAINTNGANYTRFSYYDKDKIFISTVDVRDTSSKQTPAKTRYMRVGVKNDLLDTLIIQAHVDRFNNDIVPPKSHKTTVLTPCQLMKVGDVSDRLYWDSSKGRYVVEKNIKTTNLPIIENVTNSRIDGDNGGKCSFECRGENFKKWQKSFTGIPSLESANATYGNYMLIPDLISINNYHNTWLNGDIRKGKLFSINHVHPNTENSYITLLFRDTNCTDVEEMNKWVMSFSGKIAYYRLVTPQLIETNITEELKLPTYINNTYISVNGGIQGSIRAKAPIDGGKVIKNLQRENTEIKATNDKQDELINTTMLATDEMLMMLEPLLSETVLSALESLRSTDKLVDMYAVMVKRGLKSEYEINEKYRDKVIEKLKEQEGR